MRMRDPERVRFGVRGRRRPPAGRTPIVALASCILAVGITVPGSARAETPPGRVLGERKISATRGGFEGVLRDGDNFGISLARLPDLDGDGIDDLVTGARGDDDGGSPPDADRGAVWILFLNADGTVRDEQKISQLEGGFTGELDDEDGFGHSVAVLGDLDGNGLCDLATGARHDDDGGAGPEADRGAVWILFLNADGTVREHQKISATEGGFTGELEDDDRFGISVAALGDYDGDDVVDLLVGAYRDDDGGENRGAVWMLYLRPDGTVRDYRKISSTTGGFGGALEDDDRFGIAGTSLGDLDGDGVQDLAVGAYRSDDGGENRGAVWILWMNADGTVRDQAKISDTEGRFGGGLDDGDLFGNAVSTLPDLDGDGVGELAVGTALDDDGGPDRGAVWILFLNRDGTVRGHQKISATEGGFLGPLGDDDRFGYSVLHLGDVDGDGVADLASGPSHDDDGGEDRGAIWLLRLSATPCFGGRVNAAAGSVADVLRVDGSAGGPGRVVTVGAGETFRVSVDAAPAGFGTGRYVLYVWRGDPEPLDQVELPWRGSSLGCAVLSTPLGGAGAGPVRCLRGAGVPASACGDVPELGAPPSVPWSVDRAFARASTWTLQGILEDAASAHPLGFSVTNGIVLEVLP